MTPIDYVVVLAYLAGVLWLSASLASGIESPDDYYVAGRNLPWWSLGLSSMATQSSANSFIGIPAFVALVPGGGLTWLQYELALPLALLVVMVVLVPIFRGLGLVSIYEYLELRFDRPTRLLLSGVFLVSRSLATGVALYAAAMVVEICTGLPLIWNVMMMGGFTIAYDMLGGMRAVVWTDVAQMIVLVSGIGFCAAYASSLAGGLDALWSSLPAARLRALDLSHGIADGSSTPMWGFLVGGMVLYIAYYGVDQSQVQRQLSATSIRDAQRLLAFNAVARFPLTLAYAGLGLLLLAAYVREESLRQAVPADRLDQLVPRFIEMYLPTGVRGLLVAALLAAAMSSLDSALNSLSAATMRDFLGQRIRPAHLQLRLARSVTLGWGVFITFVGTIAGDFASSVVEGINRVGALFYGPLLAAFFCGILDRRASGASVRWGVGAGLGANLVLWALLGNQLFWMWWNACGVVVAASTSFVLARVAPETAGPGLLQTSLSTADLRTNLAGARPWTFLLPLLALILAAILVTIDRVAA